VTTSNRSPSGIEAAAADLFLAFLQLAAEIDSLEAG
jgi:hypothetical protein